MRFSTEKWKGTKFLTIRNNDTNQISAILQALDRSHGRLPTAHGQTTDNESNYEALAVLINPKTTDLK